MQMEKQEKVSPVYSRSSWDRIQLMDFLLFLPRETTFVTSCWFNPFRKAAYSKRKEFTPSVSKFFFSLV